jgi:hypothetical protein
LKQSSQIWKPQGQFQQNGNTFRQQWHWNIFLARRRPGPFFSPESFIKSAWTDCLTGYAANRMREKERDG